MATYNAPVDFNNSGTLNYPSLSVGLRVYSDAFNSTELNHPNIVRVLVLKVPGACGGGNSRPSSGQLWPRGANEGNCS